MYCGAFAQCLFLLDYRNGLITLYPKRSLYSGLMSPVTTECYLGLQVPDIFVRF